MDQHIKHCLDQVERFAGMLESKSTERSRDSIVAQLAFNWGRYVELAHTDGRADWKFLETCLENQHYKLIAKLANERRQI